MSAVAAPTELFVDSIQTLPLQGIHDEPGVTVVAAKRFLQQQRAELVDLKNKNIVMLSIDGCLSQVGEISDFLMKALILYGVAFFLLSPIVSPFTSEGITLFGTTFAPVLVLGLLYFTTVGTCRKLDKQDRADHDIHRVDELIERLELAPSLELQASASAAALRPYKEKITQHDFPQFSYVQLNELFDNQWGFVSECIRKDLLSQEQKAVWSQILTLQGNTVEQVIDRLQKDSFMDVLKANPILFVGIVQHLPKAYLEDSAVMDILVGIYQEAFLGEEDIGEVSSEKISDLILRLTRTVNFQELIAEPERDFTIETTTATAMVNRDLLMQKSAYFRRELTENPEWDGIHIQRIPSEIINSVVDFIHNKPIALETHPIESWLEAAVHFEIDELMHLCDKFLLQDIERYEDERLRYLYLKYPDMTLYAKVYYTKMAEKLRDQTRRLLDGECMPLFLEVFREAKALKISPLVKEVQGRLRSYLYKLFRKEDTGILGIDVFLDRFKQALFVEENFELEIKDTIWWEVQYGIRFDSKILAGVWETLKQHPTPWLKEKLVEFYRLPENRKPVETSWSFPPHELT